jgi:3-isopropylmalate dehydratase small subunit
MDKLQGRVWLFDDNVDTDQILPGLPWPKMPPSWPHLPWPGSKVADFAKQVQAGDIIVAGKNFGCGSSREQAPVALKNVGVGMIIANSFARIFPAQFDQYRFAGDAGGCRRKIAERRSRERRSGNR